jgi:hypothetical protein
MPEPPTNSFAAHAEALYVAAAEVTAPLLWPLAQANGRAYVSERFELQPAFKAALDGVAAGAHPRPSVSPRLKVDLSHYYTGIGPCDVSLDWPGSSAYGELKSGADTSATANCVWDAPKLALMVLTGAAVSGHLIASAPAALWRPATAGLELFFDREWDMLDLRGRHASWWRKWEREGLMPLRIPARLRTFDIASFDFRCDATPWRLGIARVEPLDDGWLEWPPFYPELWEAPA